MTKRKFTASVRNAIKKLGWDVDSIGFSGDCFEVQADRGDWTRVASILIPESSLHHEVIRDAYFEHVTGQYSK